MPTWDAGLYLRFAAERGRPAADLIARVHLPNPARILDAGCGPGNSAQQIHERWPQAAITGLDSSSGMLAKARAEYPQWTWVEADAATWTSEHPFDLVFSNAVLHWVAHHEEVLPHLWRLVRPGGALAVQMPGNFHAPVHQIMAGAAAQFEPKPPSGRGVESLPFYYDLLQPLASALDLWETEYLHIMENPEAILEWMRGSGMRPYLEALRDDEQRRQFQDLCLARFAQAYPRRPSGKVLFPFRRIFMIAYK